MLPTQGIFLSNLLLSHIYNIFVVKFFTFVFLTELRHAFLKFTSKKLHEFISGDELLQTTSKHQSNF